MLKTRGSRRPVAVVGAGGFLGTALTASARRAGVPVAAFTRAFPCLSPDGVLAPRLAAAGTVFWLASAINPALAEASPELVAADRATFVRLLDGVRRLPEPPRLVLLSSGGTVYDPDLPPPYAESAPTRPRTAYGRAKVALERTLAGAGLPDTVVLRVANVYGPGQPAVSGQGVIGYWLRAAARGEALSVYGDPDATRDYVYVGDVVEAMLGVHRAAVLPPVLNVGSGRATSLRELVDAIRVVVGRADLPVESRPTRGFDRDHSWLDVDLAARTLGWHATTPLPAGLTAAWAAVRHATPVPAGRA